MENKENNPYPCTSMLISVIAPSCHNSSHYPVPRYLDPHRAYSTSALHLHVAIGVQLVGAERAVLAVRVAAMLGLEIEPGRHFAQKQLGDFHPVCGAIR